MAMMCANSAGHRGATAAVNRRVPSHSKKRKVLDSQRAHCCGTLPTCQRVLALPCQQGARGERAR